LNFLKSLGEILANQLAHFLRAQIISVVITGAQNIGAENNAPFNFLPETFPTSAAIKIEDVVRIFRPISITDAIKPGEVSRSLGRGHNVIDRNRVFSSWQPDFNN